MNKRSFEKFLAIILTMILIHMKKVENLSRRYCDLPVECKFQLVGKNVKFQANELYFGHTKKGVRCEVNSNFEFQFNQSVDLTGVIVRCEAPIETVFNSIELKWPTGAPKSVLGKRFNMANLVDYLSWSNATEPVLRMFGLKGFELDLFNNDAEFQRASSCLTSRTVSVECVGCEFLFYQHDTNKNRPRLIKSCEEIQNDIKTRSIFQILNMCQSGYLTLLKNVFSKPVCPVVFENANLRKFHITDLSNTFYKSNVLRFLNHRSNNPTPLNSTIRELYLYKLEDVDIDTSLIDPIVFEKLNQIWLIGVIRSIEPNLIGSLKNLAIVTIDSLHFRKLIHNGGIEWIRQMNAHVRSDLNDPISLGKHMIQQEIKFIKLFCSSYFYHVENSDVFPEHDFCIYQDFPFEQLVYIVHLCLRQVDYGCTYLWLMQHAKKYAPLLKSPEYRFNLQTLLNSSSFKSISTCNFAARLELCKRSNFHVKPIWGIIDSRILSKKLDLAIKLATYLMSIVGLVTNSYLIVALISTQNADLFKTYKHYTYLGLIAIFSAIILAIQLSSWFTECTYPYELLCPPTRKLVVFQFYKLIFKECLSNALKFMCNFAYVAFALNRIALIGKDHCKLIKFVSSMRVRVYLAVTAGMSVALSVIKCFKYRINYGHPESEYPISNELDMNQSMPNYRLYDVIFIINSISDMLNFVAFVFVNFSIDVFMAVRMRNTLNEKCKRLTQVIFLVNQMLLADNSIKKKENDDAINKVNKFVIINTLIGCFLKLPVSFLSLVTVYAQFYYHNSTNPYMRPRFGEFFSSLQMSGFYFFLSDLANLLFVISLSIQLFVYVCFDKKVKISINRLRKNDVQTVNTKLNDL